MNQSALTAGALLAGFVLFLAARDRLSVYGAILWGGAPAIAADPTAPKADPAKPSGIPGLPDLSGLLGPLGTAGTIGYDLGGFLGGSVH